MLIEYTCLGCGKKFKRKKSLQKFVNTYCSRTCKNRMPRGGMVTEECLFCGDEFTHKKSVPRKFCSHKCYSNHNKGINHVNWNNDATFLNHQLRNTVEYFTWRNSVYEKDRWICQICKKHCGKDIVAHHIKSWADYPKLRYEVNNGMVACRSCHKKIHKEIGLKTRFKSNK